MFFVRMSFWQLFSSYVWLGAKILYKKCACLTLMKLTTDIKLFELNLQLNFIQIPEQYLGEHWHSQPKGSINGEYGGIKCQFHQHFKSNFYTSRSQFHQHSTYSFYARRSRMRKKRQSNQQCHLTLVKLTPGVNFINVLH